VFVTLVFDSVLFSFDVLRVVVRVANLENLLQGDEKFSVQIRVDLKVVLCFCLKVKVFVVVIS
jgi:hypothetical protein